MGNAPINLAPLTAALEDLTNLVLILGCVGLFALGFVAGVKLASLLSY